MHGRTASPDYYAVQLEQERHVRGLPVTLARAARKREQYGWGMPQFGPVGSSSQSPVPRRISRSDTFFAGGGQHTPIRSCQLQLEFWP